MFKALSSYQFYKFVDSVITDKNNKNFILEPMCVIFRLALLQYKDKGTKLSIKNNSIIYQEPTYDQGIVRMIDGDCREDLHNLYHPILKSIEWYPYQEYKDLYDECIIGLELLNNVYDKHSTIRHTLSHYIAVIQMNDCEKYREETEINPIIDSLKEVWTLAEIKSTCSLLNLLKNEKNRDIYLDSLELILDQKEKFINAYIHKISTKY
tara:strand:+ start:2116 stop:2742 length:627 start_codon:yes stop_codon:yes gene_type:complete